MRYRHRAETQRRNAPTDIDFMIFISGPFKRDDVRIVIPSLSGAEHRRSVGHPQPCDATSADCAISLSARERRFEGAC